MLNLTESQKREIWNKGIICPGFNPNKIRQDIAGAWILWDEYGKNSAFGWHVDHIRPASRGGSNRVSNLQPLHWENNLAKSNHTGQWEPLVSGIGTHNFFIREKPSLPKKPSGIR